MEIFHSHNKGRRQTRPRLINLRLFAEGPFVIPTVIVVPVDY
jgi:hypothetical protein